MGTAIEILMVEDNPGDIRLTEECFKDNKIINQLNVVGDGANLMAFLRQQGIYAMVARPNVILLSLSLLLKEGCSVLAEIKQNSAYRHIPLVALTTIEGEEQVLLSDPSYFELFIAKPITFEDICTIIGHIEDMWLTVVRHKV